MVVLETLINDTVSHLGTQNLDRMIVITFTVANDREIPELLTVLPSNHKQAQPLRLKLADIPVLAEA